MLILLINCFAGTRIYSKALSGYNSIKQHVSIETVVTYLYTVRLDEMGKNNIKMGWIPTRDMAFSSKGKAARFRQIQGRGPGGTAPPYFWTNWGPKGEKKIFLRPPPPYLKVWICQWSVWKNVRTPSLDVPLYWTLIILLNIMVVWQTVSCLSFLLGTTAIIIIWYRIYNLNSYQLCWRQRFFAKKLLMS